MTRSTFDQGKHRWREVTVPAGNVHLSSAKVGVLLDDLASWPKGGRINLDGFIYDRISDEAQFNATARLEWIARSNRSPEKFQSQPFLHLAKVMRNAGKKSDAGKVLIEEERLRSEFERAQKRKSAKTGRWFRSGPLHLAIVGSATSDWIKRWTLGYGFAPWRVLRPAAVLYFIAVSLGYLCWSEGSFTPNSDVILTSPEWREYAEDPSIHSPSDAWTQNNAPGRDWESFSSFGYALDLVVPLLDLGQTDAWAPSPARGRFGFFLWFGRWIIAAFGWFFSGLAASAVAGSIRRAEEY